ncbi:MAG TPA: hypothetical protein VGE58_09605, partial [Daejeonella sp.]
AGSILNRELYFPFLQISMLALPFHYSTQTAPEGTTIKINIVGEAGGSWVISRTEKSWEFSSTDAEANNQVYIDQNIAWMLFSKGIDIYEAQQYWQISGNYQLGFHALKMRAFMV